MSAGDSYASFFANAQTGLLLLEERNGRILEANAAFLRMAARSSEEVMGRSFWEPPLAPDWNSSEEIHRGLLTGAAVSSAELPFRTGDGRWLLLEVSGNSSDGVVQLEVRDATGREQARLAERLEAHRLLAARTAAQFQSLHRALQTMGGLILSRAGQGRPVSDELEEVQRASERAGAVAAQLLAFSGSIELHMQPVALNDLVENMLPRLRQLVGPKTEIAAELNCGLTPVMADPVQVRRIILTLATNSKEVMEGGGTFCLRTSDAATIEAGLGSGEPLGGPYVLLTVNDNGPGFDDASWEHLYEPFFTTKPDSRKLGLGLASVYGIVRQMGGRLWTFSQPGEGATFRIYLKLAGTQAPRDTVIGLPEKPVVLLVEPRDGVRTAMTNLLRKRGYRVLPALHNEEALRIAVSHGAPDLLISRPEPELARRLTHVKPQLRILYLGGYGDGLAARRYVLPPQILLLAEPFEPQTFVSAVVTLMERRV